MENDKMRMNHIADMKQIEKEISFTKSEYRKRDLGVRPAENGGLYTL